MISSHKAHTPRRRVDARWPFLIGLYAAWSAVCLAAWSARAAEDRIPDRDYRVQSIHGWQVHVSRRLEKDQPQALATALKLLDGQLAGVARDLPASVLRDLRAVPIWMSPTPADSTPRGEYHPDAGWLRDHGRNPEMARAIEFTNIEIFPAEIERMPQMVMHELAHAYHHRVLMYEHEGIKTVYRRAVEKRSYESVPRSNGQKERAYALTNDKEFFAETTEAFLGRNDFFPFTREELRQHDPDTYRLLEQIWFLGKTGL